MKSPEAVSVDDPPAPTPGGRREFIGTKLGLSVESVKINDVVKIRAM